jgi:hypothetical protein
MAVGCRAYNDYDSLTYVTKPGLIHSPARLSSFFLFFIQTSANKDDR